VHRSSAWIVSAVIHGALLVGATLAMMEHLVLAGSGSPDFRASIRDGCAKFDRLEGLPNSYFGKGPPVYSWDPLDGSDRPNDFSAVPVTIVYIDENDPPVYECGSHTDECRPFCYGVRFIRVKFDRRKPVGTYSERKQRLENNRRSAQRLKIPSGRHALHLLGLEVVCTCRDRLESPD